MEKILRKTRNTPSLKLHHVSARYDFFLVKKRENNGIMHIVSDMDNCPWFVFQVGIAQHDGFGLIAQSLVEKPANTQNIMGLGTTTHFIEHFKIFLAQHHIRIACRNIGGEAGVDTTTAKNKDGSRKCKKHFSHNNSFNWFSYS